MTGHDPYAPHRVYTLPREAAPAEPAEPTDPPEAVDPPDAVDPDDRTPEDRYRDELRATAAELGIKRIGVKSNATLEAEIVQARATQQAAVEGGVGDGADQ